MSDHPRLLIINPKQFGYHLDTYYYCKWARADFRITYHGFDAGQPRLDPNGAESSLCFPTRESCAALPPRFLRSCVAEAGKGYDVVFIKHFPGCSLLRLRHPRHAVHPGHPHGQHRATSVETVAAGPDSASGQPGIPTRHGCLGVPGPQAGAGPGDISCRSGRTPPNVAQGLLGSASPVRRHAGGPTSRRHGGGVPPPPRCRRSCRTDDLRHCRRRAERRAGPAAQPGSGTMVWSKWFRCRGSFPIGNWPATTRNAISESLTCRSTASTIANLPRRLSSISWQVCRSLRRTPRRMPP